MLWTPKAPALAPRPLVTPLPRKLPISLHPSCVLALLPQNDPKWFDHSGHGNHGIIHGTTPTAKGPDGFAWEFDGVDDYIEGPISFNPMGDWTIIGRFFKRGITDWATVWSNAVGAIETPIMAFRHGTNLFGIGRVGSSPEGIFIDLGADHLNKWIVGVITKEGNNITIIAFMDRVEITTTQSLFWTLKGSPNYYVGRHWRLRVEILNGLIDHVRIYNQAWSPRPVDPNYLPEIDPLLHG
ncbi:MAG: hypothetical protein DDT33_01696 [Firmicutes bacterium]|nr:hypothetical protein [Bacillota bacterium]